MTQSRLNDDLEAPLDPDPAGSRRHGAVGDLPRTRQESSRIARAALALAAATVLVALASATAWGLGWVSEREMVFPLVFCLGASVLTGTVAALGWMHSRRRRDGGTDPVGRRRSLVAGVLAGLTLAGVAFGLGWLGSPQGMRTEIPPAAELAD
jgi:hypothetical protein